jgi:hypothetical protein
VAEEKELKAPLAQKAAVVVLELVAQLLLPSCILMLRPVAHIQSLVVPGGQEVLVALEVKERLGVMDITQLSSDPAGFQH